MEIVSLGSEVFDIINHSDEPPGITNSLQELQVIEEHVKQYREDVISKIKNVENSSFFNK